MVLDPGLRSRTLSGRHLRCDAVLRIVSIVSRTIEHIELLGIMNGRLGEHAAAKETTNVPAPHRWSHLLLMRSADASHCGNTPSGRRLWTSCLRLPRM
jgi:hypothetical protein